MLISFRKSYLSSLQTYYQRELIKNIEYKKRPFDRYGLTSDNRMSRTLFFEEDPAERYYK